MAIKLPEKIHLDGVKPEDLPAPSKAKYDAYYAEKARRKDITREGVAQEALDLLDEIAARHGSSSEARTIYGYALRVLTATRAEEARVVKELREKPSKDVTSEILDVKAVQAKHGIPEFGAEPAPIPE